MHLRSGDPVVVRSAGEVLATLDATGAHEGMPFMPEMVPFLGRRLIVGKRAQKVCDTIQFTGSRRLERTVLLEDLRCDGSAHDGCQAGCRLYWKEAWLRRWERGNPVAPQEAISYDIVMPVLGFNAGPVDILFGYGRFDASGASREAIMIATTIGTEFPITGAGGNGLALPVQFAGDFTKSQSAGPSSTDFNVASTGIGAVLLYRHRSERLHFQVQVTEAVHWSTEGFSANTGVSYATIGEARLVLRGFLGLDGGVFGYRFRYQAWNMSDDRFDYRSLQHGPFFGILL